MFKKLVNKLHKDRITSHNAVTILADGTLYSAFQHRGKIVKDYYKGGVEIESTFNKDNKRINRKLKIKGIKAFDI